MEPDGALAAQTRRGEGPSRGSQPRPPDLSSLLSASRSPAPRSGASLSALRDNLFQPQATLSNHSEQQGGRSELTGLGCRAVRHGTTRVPAQI